VNRTFALIAIAALVAGLVWWLHGDDTTPSAATPESSASPVASSDPGARPRPELPAPATPVASGDSAGYHIRDHTGGGATSIAITPPPPPPPVPAPISDAVIAALTHEVRAVIQRCNVPLARENLTGAPRLEAEIAIDVHDHRVTVDQLTGHVHGVYGNVASALQQCIEQRAVGVSVAAPDAPDVDAYRLTATFGLH